MNFRNWIQKIRDWLTKQGVITAPAPVPNPVPAQAYSLGELVFSHARPWKLTGLFNSPKYGLFVCICFGDDPREHSKIFLNGKEIYDGPEETIGNPLEMPDGRVWFAGENGNLLVYSNGKITKGVKLAYASCCGMFNGKPYVFDGASGKNTAINCLTSVREFQMPGGGIITMSLEQDGKLYAVSGDGGAGIGCNDGTVVPVANCQCLVKFLGSVICSSGNKVMRIVGNKTEMVDTLSCEKLMHMDVSDNHLFVAGANPDSLWVYDSAMKRNEVARIPASTWSVGQSVFGGRCTDGYWGHSMQGKEARVYRIKKV
jgi:hypothetical protein